MGRDHEPTEAEPTFVIRAEPARRLPPASRDFAQRLALFVTGVDRANAEDLLEGLAGVTCKRALAFARVASRWDSATRQGRMAVAFGNPHPTDRLKTLIAGASPVMRAVIFRRLAPWQQSLFPSLELLPETAAPPAMEEIADRLIREATR